MRETLAMLQQRLIGMATAAFEGLLLIDEQRRIKLINPVAIAIFQPGADLESLIGKTVHEATQHDALEDLITSALRTDEALEEQIIAQERTYRVRALRHAEGDARFVLMALQDVTELLRLSRARRDMIANLSHDLRTPISNIRLLLETLTANYGKNPDKDKKTLGKIAGVAEGLQHMTQELMDLSMIESGQAIMRMVDTNLTKLTRTALSYMESQIEQKHLDVINKVPPRTYVLADPEQIRRVLTNLLHNAVKFTPPDGTIRLETRSSSEPSMIVVAVLDTGSGIPPQERTRIFERFYQVSSSRTKESDPKGNTSGSGLGLAIAKHIVEAHGGKIWAEPNTPNGACICFTLPLAEGKKSDD